MSAKSNKIELSEEFMAMWREEQTLWDVMFPLYPDKNEKDKSLKRMSDFFSLTRRLLNFSYVFKLALKLH